MSQKTNFKVAFSHLTSRLKQALVATLSVTFGISMYITMNGFMTGVNDVQTELAFSTLAHISIFNDLPEDRSQIIQSDNTIVHVRSPKTIQYTEGIRNTEEVIHKLKSIEEIDAITSQVNMNVFFRNGMTKVNGLLSGVEVSQEDKLFGISESIIEGSWETLETRSDGIILGVGLAKKLSVGLNDNVVILTADGITRNFKVIGIIETTMSGIDESKGYVKINSARQLLSKNQSYATDIQINLKDFEESDKIADLISPLVDFKVESWKESNGQLDAGNELRNIIAVAVSLTILLVAGFGIYNIMNMTVNEKIKEIAIMKAMGFQGGDIVQIFLVQSIIIGVIGGIVGMVLGSIVLAGINRVPFEVATLETLPVTYRIQDYLLGFLFGIITTFVAGYLPAKRASRIDPVEIIRG